MKTELKEARHVATKEVREITHVSTVQVIEKGRTMSKALNCTETKLKRFDRFVCRQLRSEKIDLGQQEVHFRPIAVTVDPDGDPVVIGYGEGRSIIHTYLLGDEIEEQPGLLLGALCSGDTYVVYIPH